MSTQIVTASPLCLGYIEKIIEELPTLPTVAQRRRAKRMIVTALHGMMPNRMHGVKLHHLTYIRRTYAIDTQDLYYEFYFDTERSDVIILSNS